MSASKIRGFQPSYSSFLATTYHRLMELWMEGDVRAFWNGIRGFATFLPEEIKKKVRPKIEKVRNELYDSLGNRKSIDYYTGLLADNKRIDNILYQRSLPILDEIMILLDQRGYLEKGGKYLKAEDFKEIGEKTVET